MPFISEPTNWLTSSARDLRSKLCINLELRPHPSPANGCCWCPADVRQGVGGVTERYSLEYKARAVSGRSHGPASSITNHRPIVAAAPRGAGRERVSSKIGCS